MIKSTSNLDCYESKVKKKRNGLRLREDNWFKSVDSIVDSELAVQRIKQSNEFIRQSEAKRDIFSNSLKSDRLLEYC
jgi:hypothetical protein